jgi:hypothetical protein
MELKLLLDEDTEASLATHLSKSGHDVERVVEVDNLGRGSKDPEVLAYADRTDRIIVTHDDDYPEVDVDSHAGVFYGPNQRLSAFQLYRIVQRITESYPSRDAMQPVIFLTRDWL